MTLLVALIIAAFWFLLTVTLILLLIGPTLLLRPRRRTAEYYRSLGHPTTPAELSLPCEDFSVEAEHGIRLQGWLIRGVAPARGTILYLHGVGDCKIDGLRMARLLRDARFNVVLYDARRHGDSGGSFCTYGYFEKYDVTRVIDALAARNDLTVGNIGIFGTSMGAAVAIQAASVDRRIASVIAENSFATLRSIFDDYQKRMIKLPLHFLRNLVIVRSEFLAGFKASDVSPLEAVKSATIPILFAYADEDHLINHTYSLQLYQTATGPKEIYAITGARHNNTWEVGGESYRRKIVSFFEKTLA